MSEAMEYLPASQRLVSARDIVMGAAASRDWQPQHHDHDHALAMSLPGIIMNAPTQAGWFHGFAMQWAGPGARIGRWKLRMRESICPGMELVISGCVTRREAAPAGCEWVWLDLAMVAAGQHKSTMKLVICIPREPKQTCWAISDAEWQVPLLSE